MSSGPKPLLTAPPFYGVFVKHAVAKTTGICACKPQHSFQLQMEQQSEHTCAAASAGLACAKLLPPGALSVASGSSLLLPAQRTLL